MSETHHNFRKKKTPFRSKLILPGVNQVFQPATENLLPLAAYACGSQELELQDNNPHKLLLVTVGLPARGKTYTSQKIARYLEWLGLSSKAFSTTVYRMKKLGKFYSHNWYRPDNKQVCLKNKFFCSFTAM